MINANQRSWRSAGCGLIAAAVLLCAVGACSVKSYAGERDQPSAGLPVMALRWDGATSGEKFLSLPQIQVLSTNSQVTTALDRLLGRHLDGLADSADAKSPGIAVDSELLKQDLLLMQWSHGGWMLAVRNTGKENIPARWFDDLTGADIPELAEQGGQFGLSRSVVSGGSRVTAGVFSEWSHFSVFPAGLEEDYSPGYYLAGFLQSDTSSRNRSDGPVLFTLNCDTGEFSSLAGPLRKLVDCSLPKMELTAVIAGEDIKVQGYFNFIEPVELDLDEWRIPVENLRDPITSLTAVRGIQSITGGLRRDSNGLFPASNQAFFCGEYHGQFSYCIRSFFPVQMDDEDLFESMSGSAGEFLGDFMGGNALGKLVRHPKEPRLSWLGLPIIVPYFRDIQNDSGHRFVEFGILPIEAEPKPIPEALISQITSTEDLILYDWELTPLRATQIASISNLIRMVQFSMRRFAPSEGKPNPALLSLRNQQEFTQLVKAFGNACDNTVTTLTRESDRRWKFVRSGNLGLNALEIAWISWLLSAGSESTGGEIPAGAPGLSVPGTSGSVLPKP